MPNDSDILASLAKQTAELKETVSDLNQTIGKDSEFVKSINSLASAMSGNSPIGYSARNKYDNERGRDTYGQNSRDRTANARKNGRNRDKRFEESRQETLNEALGRAGSDGKKIAKTLLTYGLDSATGGKFSAILGAANGDFSGFEKLGSIAKGAQSSASASTMASQVGSKAAATGATNMASQAGAKTAMGMAGAGGGGMSSVAGAAKFGWIGIVVAAVKQILKLSGLSDAVKEWSASLKKAATKDIQEALARTSAAVEREQKSIMAMIQEPFEILKKSAQEVYDAWDSSVRIINQTQGYDKSDLQNLMAAFADRLRTEGLGSEISATDITKNLSTVLSAGLSGRIAEEFAYQATRLNAAVPTQDFFGLASTYSSIAANAMRQGKTQDEAISEANVQLAAFANNLIYASRELTGGFSTGLTDANELFAQSVKISQAARATDNATLSDISGTMTAVAGIIGAIAPDLATSITDAVYQAATGGNASSIVALRSLAGINAGNTDFLRALASNPQRVFSTLFENLAKMYNQSADAYMEKAEGYAELFGLNTEAFQRIDFNYLADAIRNMNVNSSSLMDNLNLLRSGQSTTNSELLKQQQANQYILENGLSLVLDSELGRAVQEHMWNEQLANKMMEASYGVELIGNSEKLLTGMLNALKIVSVLLNPLGALHKLADNITESYDEGQAMRDELKAALAVGAVGYSSGTDVLNSKAFKQLTTYGHDLELTKSYFELLTGNKLALSAYNTSDSSANLTAFLNPIAGGFAASALDMLKQAGVQIDKGLEADLMDSLTNMNPIGFAAAFANIGIDQLYNNRFGKLDYSGSAWEASTPGSRYGWGVVSKSAGSAIANYANAMATYAETAITISKNSAKALDDAVSTTEVATSVSKTALQNMLSESYMEQYYEQGYEAWKASAKGQGIADFDAVLSSLGISETDIMSRFENNSAVQGVVAQRKRQESEDALREQASKFYKEQIDLMGISNSYLQTMSGNLKSFWEAWNSYVLQHEVYNKAYDYAKVEEIQKEIRKEEQGDFIYALAKELASNQIDLESLKDPTVQTNALLSQILLVVSSIMNQQSSSGQESFMGSLQALARGL